MNTNSRGFSPPATQARHDREAEALRENLRKRKEQQRARAGAREAPSISPGGPSGDDPDGQGAGRGHATPPDPAG